MTNSINGEEKRPGQRQTTNNSCRSHSSKDTTDSGDETIDTVNTGGEKERSFIKGKFCTFPGLTATRSQVLHGLETVEGR